MRVMGQSFLVTNFTIFKEFLSMKLQVPTNMLFCFVSDVIHIITDNNVIPYKSRELNMSDILEITNSKIKLQTVK